VRRIFWFCSSSYWFCRSARFGAGGRLIKNIILPLLQWDTIVGIGALEKCPCLLVSELRFSSLQLAVF